MIHARGSHNSMTSLCNNLARKHGLFGIIERDSLKNHLLTMTSQLIMMPS